MSDITDKVHDKDAEIEEDESSEADAGEQVDSDEYDDNEYCICRGHDDGTFMIQCDRCTEWYHGKCIQVTPRKVKEVARWVCPLCEAKLNAGLTPTVVTHAHKKQNGAQHKASAQPRTRGDDDNPRKRKRDDEQGASGPDVKRAKSEHKSGEHKSHEHKNQEQKSADRNESKASALRTSKESALKTSKEGRAALKKSDKPRSSQTHSPPPLRHSAGTSEAQWQQQREGVRSKLVAMLQRVSSDAQTPSSDGSDARLQEIAREIEETLVEHVPRAQYLSKFRALMLSLPKNSELCSDVLRGVVSGSALVRMDEEHWAPKALQDLRAKYQHYLPVKPTEDEALATASPTGTVPPPPTTSATHDGEQRATGGDGDEKSSSERRDDRSESAAHDEVSRDAVSRDSPPINTSEHKNHVIEQQTPPGSPYQALDESDSEHVTGPNVALDDIEIDVKIDERSLEPIEFTEPAPEPVPEPVPASEPQSADLYDPDTSANEDVEPVMEVEHVEPSEYVDQIWKGMLTYQKLIPDVALRSVHLEGAKVEHLIGEELVIDGRMDLRKLVDYLPQIDFSQSRQRSTLLFKAEVGYDEYYHRMYEHLMSINRGGVIRVDEQTCSTELFKEIYLVPVLKHAPPAFIAPALKALVDSPAYRHLIGQTDELLLGVFLTRRADLAALPARPPRTPKLTPTPEVHVPPPQSHPASKPHPNPAPEVPKSVPSVRPPAGQPPNGLPGVSLPPNPNLPNPNAFLPPQLQSLLSNLIGQALGPASGSVPNPPFNPNPAPYAPQQNRGYPAQNYSAEPYEDYRGDYDEYGQQHRDAYQHQQQQHDYHSEYQHRDAYQQQQHGNNNASDYGGGHQSGDYDNYRGGYQDNNGYNHGGNYNNNNRFRGGHNNYHNNNRRGGGGFRSGGGRFRSNQRGRRF